MAADNLAEIFEQRQGEILELATQIVLSMTVEHWTCFDYQLLEVRIFSRHLV